MSLVINALENDEILTSNNFAKNSDIVFSEVVTKNYFQKIRNEKTKIIEETDLYVFYVLTELCSAKMAYQRDPLEVYLL